MNGFIDNYDFVNMDAMKYYSAPSTWTKEKKDAEARNKIFSNDWGAAEKKDGFFTKIVKDDNGNIFITPRNRNVNGTFTNKKDWLPHLDSFLKMLPNGTCLLGELYLPSRPGSKNTQTILGCLKEKAILRQQKDEFIHLYLFDCVAYNGISLLNTVWEERIKIISSLEENNTNEYVEMAHFFYGLKLWDKIGEILNNGGEGVVLMNKKGFYEPGKRPSKTTFKIKKEIQQTIDCFFTGRATAPTRLYSGKEIQTWKYWENSITGEKLEGDYYRNYNEGAPIEPVTKPYFHGWAGSLEIGALKDGKVTPIGFLSGLADEIKANFKDYAGKPIEVTCMEVQYHNDGRQPGLRHAKFVQFRPDLNVEDCTLEKIFG